MDEYSQLFPDLPIPGEALHLPEAAANGIAGPGAGPHGVLAGLNATLLDLLSAFQPGELGVCAIDPSLQLSLPVPEWATWTHGFQDAMPSIGAGGNTTVPVLTVPTDERWNVQYVRVARASGDNTANHFRIVSPAGYFEGSDEFVIMDLTTSAVNMNWPDARGEQTVDYIMDMPPGGLLLEPGSQFALRPSGAGAAATIFNYSALVRRTKLVRAIAP